METWYGHSPAGFQLYAPALYAAQNQLPEAGAQTNLGNLYAAQREFDKAVLAYKTAAGLNEGYIPDYVNLANLYQLQGKEVEAEDILNKAIQVAPESADTHYALGLSLARQKRTGEAIKALRVASALNPSNARYVYVYAVALNSTGNPDQAIIVLQGAHNAHPNNVDILRTLVAFNRNTGNLTAARTYAEKLEIILP